VDLPTRQRPKPQATNTTSQQSTAAPRPSSTLSAEQTQAAQQALAAYNAYREYQVKAMTTGKYDSQEMQAFLGDPMLGIAVHALFTQQQAGVVFHGRPTWTPKVVEVDLAKQAYRPSSLTTAWIKPTSSRSPRTESP